MRILLAIDGSFAADRARDLVSSLPWHEGDRLQIVGVVPIRPDGTSGLWYAPANPDVDPIEPPQTNPVRDALARAEREIRCARGDLEIETTLERGRPASVIIELARQLPADLIVVGHRGAGAWETMLLGSVSAEVVDQAPCPVLVARDDELGPIVLADDRSVQARSAESLLLDWPVFEGLPVTVLTVADPGIASVEAECGAVAARLREAGLDAAAEVRQGDPAPQIIASARAHRANLIIVGTRGQTGVQRLMLGSVARNVLLNAPCSVLVVRGGLGAAPPPYHRTREKELISPFG
jgi:nucleotide-binding universal stress UspA family protein